MDHRCPHRCALNKPFLRPQRGGRASAASSHGWKYDVAGNLPSIMPNTPPKQDYKEKVKARAYHRAAEL